MSKIKWTAKNTMNYLYLSCYCLIEVTTIQYEWILIKIHLLAFINLSIAVHKNILRARIIKTISIIVGLFDIITEHKVI